MKYDPIRRKVTLICNEHSLLRIEIGILPGSGASGYIARAMPASYHPIVEQRWREYGAKHGGGVDIKDLNDASDHAMRQIAHSTGNSVEDVLKRLVVKLEYKDGN